MRNILEVKNLVRSYNTATFRNSKNNVNVLKGISFQVAEGEFVGIMGKVVCFLQVHLTFPCLNIFETAYPASKRQKSPLPVYSDLF